MMTATGLFYFVEGIAVAFFVIMAIQNLWQHGNRLRTIMGWILAYWAVQHLLGVAFTSDFLSTTRYFSRIINAVDMTAEPTCAFLLFELCMPGWLTKRRIVCNEMPFIILGTISIFTEHEVFYYILVGFFWLYGTTVMIITFINIPKYNRFLREHYSYEENINLRWLYIVLLSFTGLMVAYTICSIFDTVVGDIIYMSGSILCWAWICYCIQRQESVLDELENVKTIEIPVDEEEPGTNNLPELDEVIETRFIAKQLYLNPQLKLGDMAQAIGTNRTYLSRYLNDVLNTNFYDYVNALRLNHARQMIENAKELNIMTIAQLAGFNSYSTFRRTFIAKYKISPQEYRNQHG